MTAVYDLTAEDAPALTALYGEYGWWNDREVDAEVRTVPENRLAVHRALGLERSLATLNLESHPGSLRSRRVDPANGNESSFVTVDSTL